MVSPAEVITFDFSTPMDTAATAAAFSLSREAELVAGEVFFDTTAAVLAFRPREPLGAGTYTAGLDTSARDAGGTYLPEGFAVDFDVSERSAAK